MRALDFGLRLLFFAVVPFFATRVSVWFPMTGALLNFGVMLVVFVTAEAVRNFVSRSPLLSRILARYLAFEVHYRENPPRPFLFYVFYPLLLPVVLWRRDLRRELWLYRGMTGVGLLLLIVVAVIDYLRNWQPELGLQRFLITWSVLYLIQTLSILLFLLPVVTTVVHFHQQRRTTGLRILLGVAALSISLAAVRLYWRHGHTVSWVTQKRVALRTAAAPAKARTAQLRALRVAFGNMSELRESTDKEGWVEGDSLGRVEEELEQFYRADEAYSFSLHAWPIASPDVLLLQSHVGHGKAPIWRALRRSGKEIISQADLPPGILGLPPRTTRKPPSTKKPRQFSSK